MSSFSLEFLNKTHPQRIPPPKKKKKWAGGTELVLSSNHSVSLLLFVI